MTTEEALIKINPVINNRYKILNLDYKNKYTKVECECNSCNNVWITTYTSLYNQKSGCPKCKLITISNKKKFTQEMAEAKLDEISKNKYTYKPFRYTTNGKTRVSCKCLKCNNKWETSYMKLTSALTGCPKCAIKIRSSKLLYTQDEAINIMKLLKPNCDFSKFKYIRSNIKGLVICENKHEWMISLDNFIQNKCCPKCNSYGYSQAEKEIVEYIKTY